MNFWKVLKPIFSNLDLTVEFEVPATFQYIGLIKGKIIDIATQDRNNEKIEICIIN